MTGWAVATGAVRGASVSRSDDDAPSTVVVVEACALASSTCLAPGRSVTGAAGWESGCTTDDVEGTATGAGGLDVSAAGGV